VDRNGRPVVVFVGRYFPANAIDLNKVFVSVFFVFVILIFVYVYLMNRLDVEFGVDEN